MMLFHLLADPFIEFGFMRRALIACIALSISATPLGVFLLLRRMSLVGDALSHADDGSAAERYCAVASGRQNRDCCFA
jgi:zinc/manganese transport system permease protein